MTPLSNAFSDLEGLRAEIERAFDGRGVGRWRFPFSRVSFLPAYGHRAYPLLNVSEDEDNLYVEALAPGVSPDSLQVSVQGDDLTIAGEKAGPAGKIKPEAYHRSERSAGKFVRTVSLPVDVNNEKISAEYKNGLLKVTMPKAEESKPRKIAVNVN